MCRERATGELVGSLQATIFRKAEASIAYAVFVNRQRKGFAFEAVRALLEHLRSDHRVQVVTAHVDAGNLPSQRLLEKLGFVRQGGKPREDVYELRF
jgi:aminoglycoside 6'-N-acetyltransferase